LAESKVAYHKVLDSYGNSQGCQASKQLQYLCHKNVAIVEQTQGNFDKALNHSVQAAEIEDTDVVLWHRIGRLAELTQCLGLARYAYERALQCAPRNWLCLIRLLHVLTLLNDDVACLKLAQHALRLDPGCHIAQLHQTRLLGRSQKKGRQPSSEFGSANSDDCFKDVREVQVLLHEKGQDQHQHQHSPDLNLAGNPWLQLGLCLLNDFVSTSSSQSTTQFKIPNQPEHKKQKTLMEVAKLNQLIQLRAVTKRSTISRTAVPHADSNPSESNAFEMLTSAVGPGAI
jgi:tetratricopeptide (TPR) repeat protein